MNVRKRSGDMGVGGVGTAAVKNAVSKRVNGPTQVEKISNTVTTPSAQGPAAIRNSVTKPSRG